MIDWNALAVLIGLAAVIVAIISLVVEVRLSSRLAQFDLITRLEDRYNSKEFLELRSEAAKMLLKGEQPKGLYNPLDQVLGFFEFLGLLGRQKALPGFVIWHSFSSDLFYYAAAAQDYIRKRHERNKAVYADLIQLLKLMTAIENKEGAK